MNSDHRLAAGTARIYFFNTQLPFRNGFSPVARCPAYSLKRGEVLCGENNDAVSGCSAESPGRIRVFFERLFSHTIFLPPVSRAVIQHVDIWSFFLGLSCRFSALRDVKTASSAVAEGTSLLSCVGRGCTPSHTQL